MACKKVAPRDEEHPGQSTCGKAVDALLRKYKFHIHSRPKGSPPLWARDGEIFTQERALRRVPRSELKDAEYEDDLYFDLRCL